MIAIKTTPRERELATAKAHVDTIDLTMVSGKLTGPEGPGWDAEYAQRVEEDYRRFLTLMLLFPEESIIPNGPVDEFWHAHVLDTRAYAADCERVFGHFVHHYPYFGTRSEADAADLRRAADRTQELWEASFGEGLYGSAMKCTRTGCKPQRCR